MQSCEAKDNADADARTAKDGHGTLKHGPDVGNYTHNDQEETGKGKNGAHAVAPTQQTHQGLHIFFRVCLGIAVMDRRRKARHHRIEIEQGHSPKVDLERGRFVQEGRQSGGKC